MRQEEILTPTPYHPNSTPPHPRPTKWDTRVVQSPQACGVPRVAPRPGAPPTPKPGGSPPHPNPTPKTNPRPGEVW